MTDIFQGKNIGLLFIGLLLIVSGIYVLFNPIAALVASALFIGIVLVLLGMGYLYLYSQTRSYLTLGLGLLDLFMGIIFLSNMGISAATVPIIFALWILFVSISQLTVGLDLKKVSADLTGWKWWVISGILGIVFSMLIFIFPSIGAFSITIIFGLYLIEYGVFEINRYVNGY